MSNVSHDASTCNTLRELLDQPLDVKVHLLQHHMELSRLLINELLAEEVREKAGERYSHAKPHDGRYHRWGTNPGSVRVGDEKLRLTIPRLYDTVNQASVPLARYQQLRELPSVNDRLLTAVLLGLSTGDYQRVAQELVDSFGLSRSSVSARFIQASADRLQTFRERDLAAHDFVSLIVDGKTIAQQQMIIALGVTADGEKVLLDFVQATTENAESIKGLFRQLLERDFDPTPGLLIVIDGGKGLRKAVAEVFGDHCVVQRCQYHKRENVVSYLAEADQATYRERLNRAYRLPDYHEAQAALDTIQADLERINQSAARSLAEGREETLTLQRLGIVEPFHQTFATTNTIENVNMLIGKYVGNVKYWQTSAQRHRWLASALLEVEHRMNRIAHYRQLDQLQSAVQQVLEQEKQAKEHSEPIQAAA
jgi:transposase-like protein